MNQYKILSTAYRITTLCLVCLLAGCISLVSTPPAPKRILLAPKMPAAIEATATKQVQVMVSQPSAWAVIDTDAITMILPGRELKYFSGARFAGPLPRLAQGFIVDALTSTGAFQGVGTDTSGIVADARLFGDIRLFALRYMENDPNPTAVLDGTFRLLDRRTGILIGTLPINIEQKSTGVSLAELVQAQEAVLEQALQQISLWTVNTLGAWHKAR